MARWMKTIALLSVTSLSAIMLNAQTLPMRGPLGIDRLIVGTVSKAKVGTKARMKGSPKPALYQLSAEGEIFKLHGHDAELKKLRGKRARITGNALGNEVTVSSVEEVTE
jgi:hypothetical protein